MDEGYSLMLGALTIHASIISTWCVMLFIISLVWLATRHMQMLPSGMQTVIEGIFEAMEQAVLEVTPKHGRIIMPFISTFWVFLIIANMVGLIPGLHSPTADLSVTSALAILVFLSVHWFGIRTQGLKKYLHHYLQPTPMLLPFHIISEFTRTLALAIRLFGNVMSLEMAAMLIVLVAGFLAPIPILMLHIIEALVQAYIFGMLALIYLASAMQSQQINSEE
ncbi:ATP synthase subunit A [Methyloprofundus sedimenti]|uniref:ATP synthase subunit a n=1 Tax=Methyloprofundus sedimenti TaxID=1420851 RepID=A0A1V8MAM6_9GAMM|nr:F0F1 ATP synthase subunit A [Methyloprofundus sedimenti]OQK18587.1 ATP synthase subunit A [Methyloprofundus sedimenti]